MIVVTPQLHRTAAMFYAISMNVDLASSHPTNEATVTLAPARLDAVNRIAGNTWGVHDLGHISRIGMAMSSAFTEAIGPWRACLPILK
ncbi:MAG: hypothetical protein ABR976_05915 [Terracidiphilus sp.]|jgi:hypothetical protein